MASDFKELIKAQQETTKAMMSAEDAAKYDAILAERKLEFDKKSEAARQGAETKRQQAAQNAETKIDQKTTKTNKTNEDQTKTQSKSQEKTAAALEKTANLTASSLGITREAYDVQKARSDKNEAASKTVEDMKKSFETIGLTATDNAEYNKLNYQAQDQILKDRQKNATSKTAKKEIAQERRALAAKQEGLLGKIAKANIFMRDAAKEKLKSAGKGIMALIKGFVVAGFALALIAFLNSDYWKKTKTFIVKTAIPAIKDFYFNTIKPFVKGIIKFFGDMTWENFKNIFDVKNPKGLVVGLIGLTALFAPNLLFKGLKLGAKLFKKALDLAGKGLGKILGFGGKGAKGGAVAKGGALKKVKGGKGAGAGIGSALGNIGKGLGKGLTGILRGIAGGFMAFANPAVAIGAAAFAAAIVLVGGAVAGAAYLLGKAMPTLSGGFKSFEELDGDKLLKVGKGIAAIGAGMAAFGAGAAVEGVGSLVGSIAGLFGGKDKLTPLQQLKIFGDTPINAAQATANAKGLVSYSKAMAAAGGGQAVAGIGSFIGGITGGLVKLFGGDSPLEKLKEFGDMDINQSGVIKNAAAVAEYSKAMSLLKGDITGADLVKAERANRVNQAGVERSGGGGAPVIVNAPSTNVVNSSTSSSATHMNTPLQNNNPTVNAVNYSF